MGVTVRSYSKINLGLAIGPVRPDGFHALATLYQTLEAHDLVRVELRSRRGDEAAIVLSSNDARVPLDGRNTVWKMLERALKAEDRQKVAVRAHIEKRLPVQGGLGAGSANAVAALVGLERLIAREGAASALSGTERLRMAAEVGSDVPLFLLGGAVLGLGRGEEVVPTRDLPRLEAVVALPEVGVSTPQAFRDWDLAQATAALTETAQTARLSELSRALSAALCEEHASGVFAPQRERGEKDLAGTLLSTLVQTGIFQNDFEQVVFRQYPLLSEIKRALAGEPETGGCVHAALSGSGSAVFGLYATAEAASAAAERLNRLGTRSLRTHTVGRGRYWAEMVVDED